ncbi:MAG: DNA recombination protein RmuC [Rickettsiaceae bacterium]|nr:MAG: DNA recombination protein RmuC [Rickettsiaceae bacterium]
MITNINFNDHGIIICSLYILLLISLALIYVKNIKLKLNSNILVKSNNELLLEREKYLSERISIIQKIEQSSAEIKYLNHLLLETEQARSDYLSSAKATLFDLSGELSKQLIDIHKKETQEARELSEKNIYNVSHKFNNEFERLINLMGSLSKDVEQSRGTVDLIKQSLLSPSGAGKLAEITLENILKASGLRAKLDFSMQYTVVNHDKSKLRPDALVFLPSDSLMIIDAKASKFLLEEDQISLSKTMNAHLKSLNTRDYAGNVLSSFQAKGKPYSKVITLMFLPSEHAVEKILDADDSFLERAWAGNIFPVGPAGLMNMLSFAKFQISDYRQTENHKLILEEVRQLLSSISIINDYSQKVGANIKTAASNYDKFATSFDKNFLNKVRNIQKLGIIANSRNLLYNSNIHESTFDDIEAVENKNHSLE